MNWMQELSNDKNLQVNLFKFLNQYGKSGLEQALQLYSDMQQEYICKTKLSVSKIQIYEIYYLEIMGHHIDVHTEHGTYQKYGKRQIFLRISLYSVSLYNCRRKIFRLFHYNYGG